MIHPTAIVEPGAQLGADCDIRAHAIVTRHCVLGDRVVVHPFAVVGGEPQYLKFDPSTDSRVTIGSGTVVREHVTINRSIHSGGATVIGAHCFLMAAAHVGHDCAIADHVVLANASLLAGHVTVGEHTFMGGGAAAHQFCRIGESVMVGGNSRITRDLPPFTLVAERDELVGFNVVGLKRRGISREAIGELKRAYQAVYHTSGNIRDVAAKLLDEGGYRTPEAHRFIAFFRDGKRSFVRPRRGGGEPGE